jgi:uncharacterized phage protein (TIGR01671 family)
MEMNREIKFRAWTGLEMEYRVVVGKLGAFYVAALDPQDSASMSSANTIYPKETPIMQYTSLKDKNGKEIWEGDIVNDSYMNRSKNCEIKFSEGAFIVQSLSRVDIIWEHFCRENGCCSLLEVIGNIYEHPQLLEK